MGGVLCENCIVDASIFIFLGLFCCVSSSPTRRRLVRHGLVGCVWCVFVYGHMVDALACWADEGRERLRYASGSCQLSVDPRMSEWGNPAAVMCGYLPVNI